MMAARPSQQSRPGAQARHARRRRALLIAGWGIAALVVALVILAVATGAYDPTIADPLIAGSEDGDPASTIFGVLDLVLVTFMVVSGLAVTPWAIYRVITRRRLRNRPEPARLDGDALARLPAPVSSLLEHSRFLRVAIDEPLARWAGVAAMDSNSVGLDDQSQLPTEITTLGRDWWASFNGLDAATKARLADAGAVLDRLERLLAAARRGARGEPLGEDVPSLSEQALDELDTLELAVSRAYGLEPPSPGT